MGDQKLALGTWANATPEDAANESVLLGQPMVLKRRILLAELNAGVTLIPDRAGKMLNIVSYAVTSNGGFDGGGGTSVILQDSNSSPVIVTTIAKAGLTAAGKVHSGIVTGNTNGAGMLALTLGKGLAIAADASLSTGTSIDLTVIYFYTNA